MAIKVTDAEVEESAKIVSTLLQKAKDAVDTTLPNDPEGSNNWLVEKVFQQMISRALTERGCCNGNH